MIIRRASIISRRGVRNIKQLEDHFARVNTAMTRGKAAVRVGVIHPIESYWLHWGPSPRRLDPGSRWRNGPECDPLAVVWQL